MLARSILFATSLFGALAVAGAQSLPVLQAKSKDIDIIDGDNIRKAYWVVVPEEKLDVYYAQRAPGKRKITFKSDLDSISFELEPGEEKDFDVVLPDGTHAHTRISRLRQTAKRSNPTSISRIPFKLGTDGKIHIEAAVNGKTLDMMFDTGADTTVVYPTGLEKLGGLKFDGQIENSGAGGTTLRQTSNDNAIKISDLEWPHEQVLNVEKQADISDGIIGWNIFEDKVLQIDYDKLQILVHDQLPRGLTGYNKSPLQWNGTLMQMPATLKSPKGSFEEWLIIDTGSNSAVMLNRDLAKRRSLYGTMPVLGTSRSSGVGYGWIESEVVELPSLTIAGTELTKVPTQIEAADTPVSGSSNLLGMEVLKRFNMLIDLPHQTVYVKPSGLVAAVYHVKTKPVWLLWVGGILIIFVGAGIGLIAKKRLRR